MIHKKVGLMMAMLVFLSCFGLVLGEIKVGVKAGDWIEYDVITSGVPPEEHNVQWARMDILSISDETININVTTQTHNATVSSYLMVINLERGEIGAWFIIPKGLNVGDSFYDINYDRNFTIKGQTQQVFAGVERTVTSASTSERIKQWDKDTGVFVSSVDTLQDYWINATAVRTNMWGSQVFSPNSSVLYVGLIVATIVFISVIFLVIRRRASAPSPDL